MRFGKSQWSSFDLGVYKVNAIPEVQVTNTRMDQWGFQGITILLEILGILLLRELLRDLENLNGVPLLQGSLYTMRNNNIFSEGALVRFGKISMEFLHLGGGLQGIHCEIWENLNGVPSAWGEFTRDSNCEIKENLNGVPSLGGFTMESL